MYLHPGPRRFQNLFQLVSSLMGSLIRFLLPLRKKSGNSKHWGEGELPFALIQSAVKPVESLALTSRDASPEYLRFAAVQLLSHIAPAF